MMFSDFIVANFFKKESRSPRGFLPRPLLRAGESVAPPPLPQKNSGGAHHFRFRSAPFRSFTRRRVLDLCIIFGKMISKACPVGNLFSFGVCEGFNSGVIASLNPMREHWVFTWYLCRQGSKDGSGIQDERSECLSLSRGREFLASLRV